MEKRIFALPLKFFIWALVYGSNVTAPITGLILYGALDNFVNNIYTRKTHLLKMRFGRDKHKWTSKIERVVVKLIDRLYFIPRFIPIKHLSIWQLSKKGLDFSKKITGSKCQQIAPLGLKIEICLSHVIYYL